MNNLILFIIIILSSSGCSHVSFGGYKRVNLHYNDKVQLYGILGVPIGDVFDFDVYLVESKSIPNGVWKNDELVMKVVRCEQHQLADAVTYIRFRDRTGYILSNADQLLSSGPKISVIAYESGILNGIPNGIPENYSYIWASPPFNYYPTLEILEVKVSGSNGTNLRVE